MEEKACRNTKRIEKGSAGQTYEEKDWSTRSCEEAQRTCPTTQILVIESINTGCEQMITNFIWELVVRL